MNPLAIEKLLCAGYTGFGLWVQGPGSRVLGLGFTTCEGVVAAMSKIALKSYREVEGAWSIEKKGDAKKDGVDFRRQVKCCLLSSNPFPPNPKPQTLNPDCGFAAKKRVVNFSKTCVVPVTPG
jgi:hypothetical protein